MKHSHPEGMNTGKNSHDEENAGDSEQENPWTVEKVIDQAVVYLARRDHAEGELREKLRKKGIEHALIDEAYVDMRERGYLDDARFAEIQGAILARRGWGPMQISQRLSARGVSKAVIREALDELERENETDWDELCYARLVAKFGADVSEFTQKQREKAYRYLLHRGFSSDTIRRVLFR